MLGCSLQEEQIHTHENSSLGWVRLETLLHARSPNLPVQVLSEQQRAATQHLAEAIPATLPRCTGSSPRALSSMLRLSTKALLVLEPCWLPGVAAVCTPAGCSVAPRGVAPCCGAAAWTRKWPGLARWYAVGGVGAFSFPPVPLKNAWAVDGLLAERGPWRLASAAACTAGCWITQSVTQPAWQERDRKLAGLTLCFCADCRACARPCACGLTSSVQRSGGCGCRPKVPPDAAGGLPAALNANWYSSDCPGAPCARLLGSEAKVRACREFNSKSMAYVVLSRAQLTAGVQASRPTNWWLEQSRTVVELLVMADDAV